MNILRQGKTNFRYRQLCIKADQPFARQSQNSPSAIAYGDRQAEKKVRIAERRASPPQSPPKAYYPRRLRLKGGLVSEPSPNFHLASIRFEA